MLIDLHCHTKAIKRGDGQKRNVDAATFVSRVSRAGVGIVAITNHNAFDLDQYNEFVCAANDAFQIWPGVELDVTSGAEGSHWHMLVVCSPTNAHVLDNIIKKLLSGLSPNDCLLKFSDVKAAFQGIDVLFISHCHDKRPFVREAELKELFDAENGPWNYFFEPRTLITVGIMASHGWNMMLGSDIKDWADYPNCELPQLRLAVDSFEQFVLLAKRDNSTIQTILEKVSPVPMVAHPHSDVNVKLPIFKEVNVIFGQKGTGKSEIAKSLKNSVEAQGLICSSYLGNQLPTIGLNAGLSTRTTSMNTNSWGSQIKNNFNVGGGFSVSIPLFDNRQTKTAVNKACIQQQQILLDMKNEQTQLYSTIENYWLQANTNQSQYQAAKVSRESAQESYNLLSEQFRLGLKNIVELRTGKDNLLRAQQNELQAKYLAILNLDMLKFYQQGRIL